MCHGQVIGTMILAVPATCQGCGAGPGPVYRLMWRQGGEVQIRILCPPCTSIELQEIQ